MNILFISNLYPAYTGQKRSEMTYALHDFTQGWIKSGHGVKVFALWDIYPGIFNLFSDFAKKKRFYMQEEEFNLDNVSIVRTPTYKVPHFPYTSKEINRVSNKICEAINIGSFSPNIIVAHGLYPSQIGLALKLKLGIPLVTGIHNTDRFRIVKGRFSRITTKLLNYSDGLVYRSSAIKKDVESAIPKIIKGKKAFVALSGIDQSIILSEEELENKRKHNTNTKIFITACNLIKRKNVDLLIKAFSELNDYNSKLIIIGDGPENQKLEDLTISLGINQRVIFHGEQTRSFVLEQLRKADFFVMISHSETFGLVYLEAMASGCIPVGTKGEGIDGVIRDGENGFLCNPTVNELSEKLQYLLSINPQNKTMLLKNAKTTTENYSIQITSQKYLNLLQNVINIHDD